MRLTLFLIGTSIILIIYFAAAGDLFTAIPLFCLIFFGVENMWLRKKNQDGKKLRDIFKEMTTDELAEIKCRMRNKE